MRYGIFGDVHGNLEAFQEVVKAYRKENIDSYICVGDIVGYGAEPSQCIDELKRLNATTVCGNHDWAAAGIFPEDYFNPIAKRAIEWTQDVLNKEEKEFLKHLGLVIVVDDFSIVHGSLYRPDFFDYITDTESAYRCLGHMGKELCFVGHSHVPVIFWLEGNELGYTFENYIKIEPEVKYIVNVGSVGQPRDNNPEAAFSIFDTSTNTIEIKRTPYDIEAAKDKILNAGLPARLGYRLLEGR
jgi:diadenosine tetraphosphatase ApaH/serine/threonine PP2A family protein phosphatase